MTCLGRDCKAWGNRGEGWQQFGLNNLEGFCGAKSRSFYTKLLAEAFLYMWPEDFEEQHKYIVREIIEVVNLQ